MSLLQAFVLWLFILLPLGLFLMNIKVSVYAKNKTVKKILNWLYTIVVIVGIILALPLLAIVFGLSIFGTMKGDKHDD